MGHGMGSGFQMAFSRRNPQKCKLYGTWQGLSPKIQETFSLRNSGDFFRKLVIVGGSQPLRANEDGIYFVGVIPFLLDPAILLGERA